MNPWKLILATVVIFGAGVVVGGMLVFYTHPRSRPAHHPMTVIATTNRPPATHPIDLTSVHQPELLSPSFVQKLDDALQLTPAQREAIQKIIAAGQEQNHCLWTNCTAQMRQVAQTVRQQIREQLNPDQKKEFEKLLKQGHPAPKHGSGGTNSIPVFPATNRPALLDTNIAGT